MRLRQVKNVESVKALSKALGKTSSSLSKASNCIPRWMYRMDCCHWTLEDLEIHVNTALERMLEVKNLLEKVKEENDG